MEVVLVQASSTGSNVFACLTLLVIALLVLLILRYYLPLRTTPAYLLVPIFLALALPASIILLVPIDVASSSGSESNGPKGIWLPERVMLVAWRITYWLCFALTWVILPLLGEYTDSGERSAEARLLHSFRSNGRYQLVVLGSCAAGLVYFSLQSGVKVTDIKPLIMALAYFWGLLFAVYLMGHGLVAIPRQLYRDASVSRTLRAIQSEAPRVHDKLEDALQEAETVEAQVVQLQRQKSGAPGDLQDWIDDLADLSSASDSRLPSFPSIPTTSSAIQIPTVITADYLATLTRQLTRARHKKSRFLESWDRLLTRATRTQAILDSSASKSLSFPSPTLASTKSTFIDNLPPLLSPYTRHLLYARVLPTARLALSLFLALASGSVIWSEVIKPLSPSLSIISHTVLSPHRTHPIPALGQLSASLWLGYMIFAALSTLPTLRIWGNRALVRRNTYPESACWYASQTAKLAIPLAYNFVTFLPPHLHRRTSYYAFLGRLIDLTPLGRGFDRFFPVLILLPVCATLFDLYGYTRRILGLNGFLDAAADGDGDDNPGGYGTGDWREGRNLIERELGASSVTAAAPLYPAAGYGIRNNPHARRAPTLSVPSAAGQPVRSRSSAAGRAGPVPLPDGDGEGEEGGFFADLGHRVRNTFDTANTPQWAQGVKKPRWMAGREGDTEGERGGVLGRLFGTPSSSSAAPRRSRDEGRIRL